MVRVIIQGENVVSHYIINAKRKTFFHPLTGPQDGVEKGTVITVVGNKMDLAEGDRDRVIKVKDGSKMAVVRCFAQN